MKRTFYRYEHVDTRLGPYNHLDFFSDEETLLDKLIYSDFRPGLKAVLEGAKETRSYRLFVSACESRAQLRAWFRGYNAVLHRLGFRVVKVESSDYHVSHGQVAVYTGIDLLEGV